MALDYLRQYARQPRSSDPVLGETSARGEPADWSPDTTDVASAITTEWAPDYQHGYHRFAGLARLSPEVLALATGDADVAYLDISRTVFLDTETTGLSTGTGTYAFLVGAGFVDGTVVRVRQFFLRSPGDERQFLADLYDFLGGFSALVTFNGKAFDWPLLESRFIRERSIRRPPLEDPLHVDLLHPARRLWKRRLQSCALSSLEANILGVVRTEEDVPGWMIPSLYFRYLRSGQGDGLRPVFYHNLQDILSLIALTIHVERVVGDPGGGLVAHASDFLALGKLFDRAGQTEIALGCYEAALRPETPSDVSDEAHFRLGALFKRERRWESALVHWDRLIERGSTLTIQALVERSKYHEHVERNYLDALDDVRRALELLELGAPVAYEAERSDLAHRQGRLVARALRHRSWAR
ncbi:MAG TPA: ribonuclease H-like domain-containing protein [Chloroflexota bacterium]|nr:ribonuclease H-like domain-containing protein [Chloroflexota bacterium]